MDLAAVRIFVKDITAAHRFYAEQLGLVVELATPEQGVCIFGTGATRLIVERVPADAPEDDRALVGRFTGISFSVDDIQQAYQQLTARGVQFFSPPEQQNWGGWLATFRDPCGNGLQLVQRAG